MAPTKIYLHYEIGEEENHVTLKLTIPKKWLTEKVEKIKNFFVETYNNKRPNNLLDPKEYHFNIKSGRSLRDESIIQEVINDREDLYLSSETPKYASSKPVASSSTSATEEENPNLLRCRNYGCNKMFSPAANEESSCKHHISPPIFHDAKKGWSCCKNRLVYDWDEFQLIEGCQVGKHSTIDPKEMFAISPTLAAAANATNSKTTSSTPVLKSIDSFNAANPDAVTAVSSATNALKNLKVPKVRTDGKAHCIYYGCQQEYVVADNHSTACRHHAKAPVFHDLSKYWACCPDNVKYDFDSFLKVPGCVVSAHCDLISE